MSEQQLLEHLGKDTLPRPLLDQFVNWCAWEQARPSLVVVLKNTGLDSLITDIEGADDLAGLAAITEKAGNTVKEARQKTGPLGLSTAEASAFLVSKLASAAEEPGFDPEAVAFFAAQVCGWSAFAETGFKNPAHKATAEKKARNDQENRLRALWQQFGKPKTE